MSKLWFWHRYGYDKTFKLLNKLGTQIQVYLNGITFIVFMQNVVLNVHTIEVSLDIYSFLFFIFSLQNVRI